MSGTFPGQLQAGVPTTAVTVFTPTASSFLNAGVASSNVAFPAEGQSLNAVVTNTGSVEAFINPGNSTVVATTSNIPLQPGEVVALAQGLNTNLAAITASGTTELLIESGTGQPNIVRGNMSLSDVEVSVASAPYIFTPMGVGQITAAATAVALSSIIINGTTGIPAGATVVNVLPETQTVRYRDDGSAPTVNLGYPILPNQTLPYSGNLSAIEFIAETGTTVIDAAFYK